MATFYHRVQRLTNSYLSLIKGAMRIGMMADVYKPHISGVTNYIALNKAHLEQLGHQVFIFTFNAGDYVDEEINVVRSPSLPLLDTGYYFNLRYTRAARRMVQTMDVVHVHHPFLSGPLALLYCRQRGIPIVFTNHTRYDLYAQAYLPVMPDVVGNAALQSYLPAFCRACDLVISPSPGMRDVLKQFGVDVPIDVVPNGVDLLPFANPGQPVKREELGFRPADIVFLFVGRLGPEKNIDFLLRSFTGAIQAYDHLRLVLIGGGPEKENLEDWAQRTGIQHAVRFMGQVDYSELPRYMAMADAFVTASVTEVHPLTVIEAMAAGLPVVGIQSPGVGDTVIDGETGYLVPKEDLAMFTAKIIRMAVDASDRYRMGQQAKVESQKYAIERTSLLLLEQYQRVVQAAAGRKGAWRVRLDRIIEYFRIR
jgi:glycosyltransferase involved in cell wall biosynthesis